MVYADSVSAISADNFKFTHNSTYPNAIQDFRKSFAFLETDSLRRSPDRSPRGG